MRNLKRALSLTLASVMLLGMMVVGSSAAAGYSDVDENDNVEAIEVLQTVQVMVGDDRGFGPDRPVTRNEMAVVMGKLLNLDYNYYSEACPFTDVADWAKGWVGAAAANGIVSGRGNGIYDGEATVTAVEAASMMMRALGYFKYQNDYADGFQVSTVRQGTKIGIFDQVGTDATTAMTRNQVAQMALNALKSGMVEPDGNTINLTTPDGSVFTGKVNYVFVTSNKDFARAISTVRASSMGSQNDSPIVELGEQLYDGKLKLEDGWMDDFGRPSRRWEYDGKAIGTYMKKELIRAEYTDKVTGKMLYDLLGSETIKTYDFDITIDGVDIDGKTGTINHNTVLQKTGTGEANSYFDETNMTKTWKEGLGQTGKGVLTQVFVNGDTKEVDVAVINTYLAQATADYSDKKDEVNLKVFALNSEKSGSYEVFFKYPGACKNTVENPKQRLVSGDDFDIEDVKKDDFFLVTVANGDVKTMKAPEVISSATLTAFSKDKYVVSDGTQYDYNTTVDYDPDVLDDYTSISTIHSQQLKDTQFNVYLDPYGYMIGIDIVDAPNNYIFLTGLDQSTSDLKNKTAEAAGILLDGTFVEFTMNIKDSVSYYDQGHRNYASAGQSFQAGPLWNTWCTYTVDKDGVYTLTEIKVSPDFTDAAEKAKVGQYHDANYSGKKIDDKHVSLRSSQVDPTGTPGASTYVYGNDFTVYLVAELDTIKANTKVEANWITQPTDHDADSTTPDKAALNGTAVAEKTDVGIISDVESVTTGIANVSLVTWDAAKIADEIDGNAWPGNVYTLFDNKGYVIAAVVVGEDDGTSKNLVYSHKDSLSHEEYNSAEDEWTWQRKVIFNGEEITLTEKGDKLKVLGNDATHGNMQENAWYEITYKADGTVKSAKLAYYDEFGKAVGTDVATPATGYAHALTKTTDATRDNAHDFVDNIEYLENAVAESGKTTVLYEQVWGVGDDKSGTQITGVKALGKKNAPSLKGSTLFVDTKASRGFYVSEDVKSVLIQTNNGEDNTTYGSGMSDLETILGQLNYNDATGYESYCFKISAIMTNGRASTVIIHDWNETDPEGSGSHGGGGGGGGFEWRSNDSAHNFLNPTYKGATPPTDDDIYDMLVEAGCTDISVDGAKWTFKKSNGMTVTQTIAAQKVVTIKLDGADKDVLATGYSLKTVAGGTGDANIFLKWIDADETVEANKTKYTASNDSTDLAEGDQVFTDKYLKLGTTPVAKGSGTEVAVKNDATGTTVTYSITDGTVTAGADTFIKSGDTITISINVVAKGGAADVINAAAKAEVKGTNADVSDQDPANTAELFAANAEVKATDGLTKTITVKVAAPASPAGAATFAIDWT